MSLGWVVLKVEGEGSGFFLDDKAGAGKVDRVANADFVDEGDGFIARRCGNQSCGI